MHSLQSILLVISLWTAGLTATATLPSSHSSTDETIRVKISVAESGIYQLTYEQLIGLGFSSPEKVGVDGLACVNEADRLLFFANGPASVSFADISDNSLSVERDPFSLRRYYMLTSDGARSPSLVELSDTSGIRIDTHSEVRLIDRDTVSYSNMGTIWFDNPFLSDVSQKYIFSPLNGYIGGKATFYVTWLTDVDGILNARLLGGSIESTAGLAAESVKTATYKTSAIECSLSDDVPIELTLSFDSNSGKGFTAIDYVALVHEAPNTLGDAAQKEMHIRPSAGISHVHIEGATEVWDITAPNHVERLQVVGGNVTPAPSEGFRRLIAFNTEKEFPSPEIEGSIQSVDLLQGMDQTDMIIVAHTDFIEPAQELAQIHHTNQNMCVKAVTSEQIFNQFSAAQPSSEAIREFVRLAHSASEGRLKYLLLYGDGSYDNRGIVEHGPFLPTFQCSDPRYMFDSNRSYCSDSYFGITDSVLTLPNLQFSHADVCVGRLPVATPAEARDINAKIERHLTGQDTWKHSRTSIILCDAGDRSIHLKNAEQLAALTSGLSGSVVHKIYSDLSKWDGGKNPSARHELAEYLRNGCGFVHYVGHGTEYSISGQNLWDNTAIANTGYDIPPFFFHSSCLNGRFDGTRRCMGEELLTKSHGGAIACIMAARNTDASYNQRIHKEFINRLAEASPGATIGDVWLAVRNKCTQSAKMAGNTSYALNIMHYNLLGDPATPLPIPGYEVDATALANVDEDSGDINPRRIDIRGRIKDSDGNQIEDIDGIVDITAYLSDITRTTLMQDGSTSPTHVAIENIPIWSGSSRVVNGSFSATAKIPGISDNHSYRIVFSAYDSTSTFAVGDIRGLLADMATPALSDTIPPTIRKLEATGRLNSAMIEAPVAIVAEITDKESGLSTSRHAPESRIRLYVDGVAVGLSSDCLLETSDGDWHFEHTLEGLCDGKHVATLSVVDNAGNRSFGKANFTVLNRKHHIMLSSAETTATETATFEWSHDLSDLSNIFLIITDINGNTVFHSELSGIDTSYNWNLCSVEGCPIAPGLYYCYLLGKDGNHYTASDRTRIVIPH